MNYNNLLLEEIMCYLKDTFNFDYSNSFVRNTFNNIINYAIKNYNFSNDQLAYYLSDIFDEVTYEEIKDVINNTIIQEKSSSYIHEKPFYELNLKELKDLFDCGDFVMLDYLEDFVPLDKKEEFNKIMDYNEIYANGLNIEDLYEMGKKDTYWKERADRFVKKYEIKEEDYKKDFSDRYFELRDDLLIELGLDIYLLNENKELDKDGYEETDNIIKISELDEKHCYTVARINNFNHSVELHYNEGIAFVEFGKRSEFDNWENDEYKVDWFNTNMSNEEVLDKLEKLFDKYKEENYTTNFMYKEDYELC